MAGQPAFVKAKRAERVRWGGSFKYESIFCFIPPSLYQVPDPHMIHCCRQPPLQASVHFFPSKIKSLPGAGTKYMSIHSTSIFPHCRVKLRYRARGGNYVLAPFVVRYVFGQRAWQKLGSASEIFRHYEETSDWCHPHVYERVATCVYLCVCVYFYVSCRCVRACACACTRVCVHVYMWLCAYFDNTWVCAYECM